MEKAEPNKGHGAGLPTGGKTKGEAQRDDKELEVWTSETRLRASIRIGELVRELEKAQVVGGRSGEPEIRLATGGKSKTDAILDSGLSTRTAHRYEELAGASNRIRLRATGGRKF